MKKIFVFLLILFPALFLPQVAYAHAFGTTYTLPIPFWLYSYAGAGVLALSFLLIGFFFNERTVPKQFPTYDLSCLRFITLLTSRPAVIVYKSVSIFLFILTIVSGLIGEDLSPYNFNMTFFWVIFVLGFTYLTFLFGNLWDIVNPWKIIIDASERLGTPRKKSEFVYPERLSYYPAFLFYLLFISIELFVGTTPFSLSVILLQYTLITFFAVYLFGQETWFRYGELFSVFFRFISYTSPVTKKQGRMLLRLPFVGLLDQKATDFSALLFILFMLSSTAFDGFRETNTWAQWYWSGLSDFFIALFGGAGYQVGSFVFLVLSPFLFFLLYIIVIVLMKYLVKSSKSVRELSFAFTLSLLPIALVYHIAHYFTLLLLTGQDIIRLISDPFGWGWNLFGTANLSANPGILNAATIWHLQVFFILSGHVVAVFIAHLIAIRLFPSHKKAVVSQFPMLLLMVVYTAIGLWILSQPLSVG